MKTQLIRPGFMIALASNLKGGVEYQTSHEAVEENGSIVTEEWTTRKTTYDAEEHEKAVKVRGAALYQIRRLCVKTPFCLLCPENEEKELDAGVEIARKLIDDFNAESVYTKINLYVLKARLLGNDEQTALAIAGEMRVLLGEMDSAVRRMDPEAIREALTKANEVSQMLVSEQQEKVSVAVELARQAAREITKAVKKKSKDSLNAINDFRVSIAAIEQARQSFLDYEEPKELTSTEEAPVVQVRDLDLTDTEDPVAVAVKVTQAELDL